MGSDSKANQFWKDEHDAKNDNPKEMKIKPKYFAIKINFPLPAGKDRLNNRAKKVVCGKGKACRK